MNLMLLSKGLALNDLLVVGLLGLEVCIGHFQENMLLFILAFDVHMQVHSQQPLEVGDFELELGALVAHCHPALEGLVDVPVEVVALVVEVHVEGLVEVESEWRETYLEWKVSSFLESTLLTAFSRTE